MPVQSSKKPLIDKLGIKAGVTIFVRNPPEDYVKVLGLLPPHVRLSKTLKGQLDFIHFFVKKKGELEKMFPLLKQKLKPNSVFWVSWPKASSNVEIDLNENVVRKVGLKNGLVDVKVVSVNEVWSGLKFVSRVKDRLN